MDPVVSSCLALGLGLLLGVEVGGPGWAWGCVAGGLVLLALPFRGVAHWWPALVVVGLVCGRSVPEGPALEGTIGLVGVRVGSGGRVADVELSRVREPPGAWRPASGRVRVRFREASPPPGTPVVVLGVAGPVRPALPGAPDPVRAARLAGVRTEVRATSARRLDGDAPPRIDPALDGTGLLKALLFGDTSACRPEDLVALRNTGTTHLLSVSGFHVGVAAAAVVGLCRALLRLVGLVRPQGVPVGAAVLVGVVSAWGYVALSGWPVPAERAAGALTLAALGKALGRRTEGLPALCLVGVAIAVLDPSAPATASFQLSFGAMAGLILVVPRLTRLVPPDLPPGLPWLVEGLAATFGSTLATLPAAAWWFQSVPPLAPLANLVALPALGLVGVPCAALAAWAPWPLDRLGGGVGTFVCALTLRVLEVLAIQPWTPAVGPVGAVLLGGAVLVALRRPLLGAVLGGACLAPWRSAPEVPTVTFLDVGQGDAALVEWPDGRRVLVDGGPSDTQVAAWLRRSGIRRLDVVVASHPERDHERGLREVLRTLRVGEVWAADLTPELQAEAELAGVPVVRSSPAWLQPGPGDAGEANDRSVVVSLAGVLFTGDVEELGEQRVAGRVLPTPVLKVAHHGSRTSTTDALLDAVRPALAVVSVGVDNPYGHPGAPILARLEARGIAVVRTDLEGTVVVRVEDDRLVATTRRRSVVLPRPRPPPRATTALVPRASGDPS